MSDKKIEDLLMNDSFVQWVTEEASADESQRWENWVSRDPKNKKLVSRATELIRVTESDELAIPDPQVELQKFEASIQHYKHQSKVSERNSISRKHEPNSFYGVVAAVLLVLVVSIGFFLKFGPINNISSQEQKVKKKQFKTAYGERISLKLSDGTLIILNANSQLRYTSSFQSGQNIDVWLEGEAYFDVTNFEGEKKRIFRVHTTDGLVEVLGTEFVVKTYSKGTRAVLKEGKVRVNAKGEAGELSKHTIMNPDKLAYFSSGKEKIVLKTVDTSVYTSWINGKWHFNQTPLADIAQRIEDTYGVEVEILEEALNQRLLSGSIKSTNLEILQKALSKILDQPITRQTDNTLVIGLNK